MHVVRLILLQSLLSVCLSACPCVLLRSFSILPFLRPVSDPAPHTKTVCLIIIVTPFGDRDLRGAF